MDSEKKHPQIEQGLLALVNQFLKDLDAERALKNISLEASLGRDLGIDSVGKVELFTRIEKTFSLRLPERAIAEIDSLKELAKVIEESLKALPKRKIQSFSPIIGITDLDLSSAKTLVDVMQTYGTKEENRPHLYLQNEQGEEQIIQYGQLLKEAKKVARGLHNKGIKQGEAIAIMLPTSDAFFYAFAGILLIGAVPVPIYPPFRADRIEEYAEREAKILHNAQARILITFAKAETLSHILRTFVPSLKEVATIENLRMVTGPVPEVEPGPQDPILIQYTSGSTGDPKGVFLSHQNMLANIRAIGKGIPVQPTDVGVSWLPLYHDMGLMNWLGAMYFGIPMVILSPLTFLTRPEQWLWTIHYHRATLSGAPNFAYELCIKKIDDEDIQGLDLSSWRFAFNGAEAINPRTLDRFGKKFSPYGFHIESFAPVYGLAESTVGLTFPPKRREPRIDKIQREAFEMKNKAIPTLKSKDFIEFVSCGVPLPDHEVRIVDEAGSHVEERVIGMIQFKGPSAMKGYFNNPNATQKIYHDGWWDTDDLGYLADKELFITGRKKDLIIKAGRNLYPEEIEEVVSEVPHVRKGCVIAFGVSDPVLGTEKLIIVAESYALEKEKQKTICAEITEKMMTALEIAPDVIFLVPPKTVPKTSSGKLRRSACKQAYLQGKLIKKHKSITWQLVKLFSKSIYRTIRNGFFYLGKLAYTIYFVLILFVVLIPVWFGVLLFPRTIAAKITRIGARSVFKLGLCPIHLEGEANLKSEAPMIFIANHASYSDALVLTALLPPGTLFTAKNELLKTPVIRTFIKKLGHLVIDRMDFVKSVENKNQIEEAILKKNSVIFFPEGTFTYATGLRPFKLGAFTVAVETKTALCPIAISGTRTFLRADSYLLTPGSIRIVIGKPLYPKEDGGWDEIIMLHNRARLEIAKYCGEPIIDLIVAGFEG
ncbi:AMP-binding protein [Legionella micdadei]|uniref:1-acyl-sn-glycerol-3-phosphate acyltransferases n=2 Tax=Legionella micdadei TaxID=451 RepID=A0A098GFH3_LEGMI|nr:AMP-binding protein [Legionella micdadei]KTD28205.1 acetyltransferase [Legionella micdadei]CEG61208.1 putative acetyltransferase [Legionella micdadei]SCY32926.1 1-acyl-sn-glycerol-3-phosphate acyltransferases [Legionella micdadei]